MVEFRSFIDAEPRHPSAQGESGLSRREAIAGIAALLGSSMLTAAGCGREKTQSKTPTLPGSEPVEPPTPTEQGAESAEAGLIEIDPTIQMPTSEIIDTPYEFPVTADLEEIMEREEFVENAKIAASAMAEYVEHRLMPKLEEIGEPGKESDEAILNAVNIFIDILASTVPEFKSSVDAFIPKAEELGHKKSVWVKYLKPFLEAGGYYFDIEEDEHLRMSFCPIIGTQHVHISDGTDSYEIPILRIGKDKIKSPFSGRRRDAPGSMSTDSAHIYCFEDKIEPMLQEVLASGKPEWPRFSNPYSSREDFERAKEMFRHNVIHHEAVHVFFSRRFPSSASRMDRRIQIKIDTNIVFTRQDKEGRTIAYKDKLAGTFHPVLIQELGAVGAHLAFSDIDGPWEHFSFFQTAGGRDQTYELARRILAVATMWKAPKSPMHELSSGDHKVRFRNDDIGEVIGKEPYTQANTRAVGEAMYRIAYGLLSRLEGS